MNSNILTLEKIIFLKNNNFLLEAKNIVDNVIKKNGILRLYGGVAVWAKCPEQREWLAQKGRKLKDIDFISTYKNIKIIRDVLLKKGYNETTKFQNFTSHIRREFVKDEILVELIFDKLNYCHTIDVHNRIKNDVLTLPISDLLLSKIQNIRLTDSDYLDLTALLLKYKIVSDITLSEELDRIVSVLCNDWPFYKTAMINSENFIDWLRKNNMFQEVINETKDLISVLKKSKKTIKWIIQSRIYRNRSIWYNLVE